MLPLLAIGAGLGLANAAGKFISGIKQTKESKKINPQWQQYKTNPFAKQQLGIAQQLFNGRMAGAPELERNIMSNQASQMANASRNATDSSQLLALGGASQGVTNDALSNLQVNEAQNKQAMLGNLNQAYGGMIDEGDKEYQSLLQKYGMDVERKDALRNAGAQNKYGAVSDLASMAFTAGTSGMFGGGGAGAAGGMRQFGGSGMGAAPYGASVYRNLTAPRTPLQNRNVIIGG